MTNVISKKKPSFQVNEEFLIYLDEFGRLLDIPFSYSDLSRFTSTVPLRDHTGHDTLWETVFYSPSEMKELNDKLVLMYAMMKVEGNVSMMEHLYVDRIDYCAFGNSKPFRIRIVNQYNDNYDYYYVKVADASRVYGLEFVDILCPNRINFILDGYTLVEEHVIGIPGDQFILHNMHPEETNLVRLAKEFVKFNERCFVRLLGDMRSYNFVIDRTSDFDDTQYRFRAIDFDQQSYEGKKTLYLPQYFKENLPLVKLCMDNMNTETVSQYQLEERSLMSKRFRTARYRVACLLEVMINDQISTKEKIESLREELAEHYQRAEFKRCRNMGEIMRQSLDLLFESPERNIHLGELS